MRSRTAEELTKRANAICERLLKPTNTDDALWMRRGIEDLRRAATHREKAALVKRIERAKRRDR